MQDVSTGVQAWTPAAAVTGSITSQSLTMTNNNAGEYADYTFSFKTDTGYAVGETIEISFPHEFDLFVGEASQWFTNEPDTYYLNCESTAMSLSWCTVSKWKVQVMGSAAVEATTAIDITINYVKNPAVASPTASKMMLAVYDANMALKSYDQDFVSAGVTIAAVPVKNIVQTMVHASNHNLFGVNAEYTFKFYLDQTSLGANENLQIMFPMSYNLNLDNGASDYTCDTTVTERTGDVESWNDDNTCAASGNWVMLDAKAYTLDTTD